MVDNTMGNEIFGMDIKNPLLTIRGIFRVIYAKYYLKML
ncbi:hypothetical protein C7972_12424 [Arenibacter sp. ARW7G5Y1]|nr:hypothetical protein C7972_12424 [Arenibacter sp. ARW7G5Y1]